jgi:hypothetical protein
MALRKATRQAAKLRIGLSAASGFGKTASSLLLAYGLVGDWNKIAVIDTENGSGDLYANDKNLEIGQYNILTLRDYSPNDYVKAIRECEKEGMEVIIIDSCSHEWVWCVDYQQKLGGTYNDWRPVKLLHNAFKKAILDSSAHIITTVRRKTDYLAETVDGKLKITKAGLKEEQDNSFEYELTTNFEILENHLAKVSKDRTNLFKNQPEFIITAETGKKFKEWSEGTSSDLEVLLQGATIDIANCVSEASLASVYKQYLALQGNKDFITLLSNKKQDILNQKS